jgi:ribosomal protein L12E/L44/L45/RPP1/RPP2
VEEQDVVEHAFNPSRGRQISEFQASLVYKVSSRTARARQRNSASKTKTKNMEEEKEEEEVEEESRFLNGVLLK